MPSKRSRAVFESDQSSSPFVVYGTPLPPEDSESRDDGSYVPIWKQEVRDEKGRKRLHGAFTGGFSAGYFNTVGSKEGWTPSTFVSSRQNRAKDRKKQTQQRAEDFMDDEDIKDMEESRALQTSNKFEAIGSTATDSTREAGLMDLFGGAGETAGVRLLKKMGWKDGQGIGPKVRRKANLGPEDDDDDSNETHLFVPEDSTMISFVAKNDRKGLGFEGEYHLGNDIATAGRSKIANKSKVQKLPKRGGFGVGILNDTGSDDEDPYEIGPTISYNRTVESSKKSSGKRNGTETSKASIKSSNPLLNTKPIFISKRAAASQDVSKRCRDGRLPLEGFTLGVQVETPRSKGYDPPKVPDGWVSFKAPLTAQGSPGYISTAEAARASKLDSKARAAILGEAQLPSKSVFDYMTPEARERLVAATGRTDLPPALGEKAPKGFEVSEKQKRKDIWDLVPELDKDSAIQALNRGLNGWMPYAEDETKKYRYRSFLEFRAGISNELPPLDAETSVDEWVTELREFARAAEIFKPISSLMASRFTSSSTLQPQVNTQRPDGSPKPLLNKPPVRPEDPAESAARIGMYGPMTRIVHSFTPARLLCKRFNVRVPSTNPTNQDTTMGEILGPSGYQSPKEQVSELLSKETMNKLMAEPGRNLAPNPLLRDEDQPNSQTTITKQAEIDPNHNPALEAERPGEAVFKAIFGSDEEDDE
ncbi:hypothetical protein FQN57_006874 [Myotisia sp. PD_48]|nr:hypothetical protein FQN57_006874 [Myotisia sp. PD_48]